MTGQRKLCPTGSAVGVGVSPHPPNPATVDFQGPQAVTSQAPRPSGLSLQYLRKSRGRRGFPWQGLSLLRSGAGTCTHLFSCPAETSGRGEGAARASSAGPDKGAQALPTSSNSAPSPAGTPFPRSLSSTEPEGKLFLFLMITLLRPSLELFPPTAYMLM